LFFIASCAFFNGSATALVVTLLAGSAACAVDNKAGPETAPRASVSAKAILLARVMMIPATANKISVETDHTRLLFNTPVNGR
jgi:hypothetical protein